MASPRDYRDDQRTVARAERAMKENLDGYRQDRYLQEQYSERLERLGDRREAAYENLALPAIEDDNMLIARVDGIMKGKGALTLRNTGATRICRTCIAKPSAASSAIRRATRKVPARARTRERGDVRQVVSRRPRETSR
jgi:hypothetical protein